MAATYLINGQSPQYHGVVMNQRQLVNQGIDMLSMVIDRPVDGVVPFTYDQVVTVTRDGTPYFKGRVMTRLVEGQPAYEGMRIDVGGVWWMLSRLPYVKLTLETTGEQTTRFRWGLSAGTQQTSLELINQVFTYAIAKGVDVQTETFVLDTYKPPRMTKMDRRCDDLIRSALMGHPDVALWFDYSTTPPTARITKRGAEGAVITYAVGTPPLATMAPQARPDLVPSGVVYRYERGGVTVSNGGMRPAVMIDKWPVEAVPDTFDAIPTTVTLAKGQVALAGAARRLYEALSVMPWEGGITLQAEDCVSGIRPGLAVNITGGQEDWETMQAFVQTVDEDLHTGATSVGFGLPQYYGKGPTLLHIERLPHNDREKDGPGAGESEELGPEAGMLVEAEGPLCGSVERLEDGTCVFRIAPGFVFNGDPEEDPEVPEWETSGDHLDDVPPPGAAIAEGATFSYYLYIEATPDKAQKTVLDAEGAEIQEWRFQSGMTFDECRIEFGTGSPSARRAVMNHTTGEITETLRAYIPLGRAYWTPGAEAPVVESYRVGSMQLLFAPPFRLRLITA